MGYYDKFLMHEDRRDKGMNSTSNEKGIDGKKNNTSEYNHQYYMKNKAKWQKDGGQKATYGEYDKNDPDFDDKNYSEDNRVGDTDFFIKENPDGSLLVLEEDMKWVVPSGANKEDVAKALEALVKEILDRRNNAKTLEEFKAAGANWLKDTTDAINSTIKGSSKGSRPTGNEKTASSKSSSTPRSREKNVTGSGKGVYRRGEGLNTNEKVGTGTYMNHFEEDEEYLAHHGIKGQKWGVRRFQNADGSLNTRGKIRYGETSDLYNAKKGQLKSTMKSMGNTIAANVYGLNKKAYKNSNKTLSSMNAAKETEFRKKAEAHAADMVKKSEAKKAYKEEYKKNLQEARDKASLGEKFTYNDATRRRAAKIMTKYKDVSYEDATKQAKKEAVRNTAIILAAYGAIMAGTLYSQKKAAESYNPISSSTLAKISSFRP